MYHLLVAKIAASLDLALPTPRERRPLGRWLYNELRAAILDSRLKRGARLPATRDLALRYGLSRGTVVTVFEQLQSEGYLEGRVGSGGSRSAGTRDRRPSGGFLNTPSGSIWRPSPGPQPARAFRDGEPALDSFPLALWTRVASRRLRGAGRSLLAEGDPLGYRPLREVVADYLGTTRGVKCTASQVVIVSGIQQALDLTSRVLLNPGDLVWMEDPGYFGATGVFKALGAKIIPVPVDQFGLNIAEGERRAKRAKLAYVTPAHQYPLGVL